MNAQERVQRTARYIADTQLPSGAIPWFDDGKIDPWNHTEAAMGLSIAGLLDEAEAAYEWLAGQQRGNGSWFAEYDNNEVAACRRIESNFVAYIATGVWHHYLITGRDHFLKALWPNVEAALRYTMNMQADTGEVFWAYDLDKGLDEDALVTGCSSIFKSLRCGADMARTLGDETFASRVAHAADRLGESIRHRPDRFDRTWESKARFSMDWFYPVMCGVLTGNEARQQLAQRRDEFLVAGLGCKCVADEPWVTMAETSELAIASVACNNISDARQLLEAISRFQVEDGSWWTGYQYAEDVLWPNERPTWTAGAFNLAVDALEKLTNGHTIFGEHPPRVTTSAALA